MTGYGVVRGVLFASGVEYGQRLRPSQEKFTSRPLEMVVRSGAF